MQREVYIKMFNEIIKHGERDNCYNCKQIMEALDLKERMKNWNTRDLP